MAGCGAGAATGSTVTWTVSPRLMTGRSRWVGVYPSGYASSAGGTTSPGWVLLWTYGPVSWTYAGTRKSRNVAVRSTSGP